MDKLREFLKRNDKVVTVAVGVLVVAIAGWAILTHGPSQTATDQAGEGTFFTTDDGATYFKGSADQVPPFDVNGKTAYGAHVGTGDGGVTKVYYLDRFTPKARDVMVRLNTGKPVDPGEMKLLGTGREYKRVGENQWHTFANDGEKKNWLGTIKDSKGKQPYGLW